MFYYDKIKFPIGYLCILVNNDYLIGIHYTNTWNTYLHSLKKKFNITTVYPFQSESHYNNIIKQTIVELNEYFSDKRKNFTIPYLLLGTPFQKKSWEVLATIEWGTTISYEEQAKKLGNINFTRAVGKANSKNPISIILPCHRVIGKRTHTESKKLTGYAGGLDKKQYLLELEGAVLDT